MYYALKKQITNNKKIKGFGVNQNPYHSLYKISLSVLSDLVIFKFILQFSRRIYF